jgi:hypothetical protein
MSNEFPESLFEQGSQRNIFDEFRHCNDVINAPTYKEIIDLLIVHGNLDHPEWNAEYAPKFQALMDAWVLRHQSEGNQSDEAKQIGGDLAGIVHWFDLAIAEAKQAADNGVPGASKLLSDLERSSPSSPSFRQVANPLESILATLAAAGDLTRFGMLPTALDDLRALKASVHTNRFDLHAAQTGIQVGAGKIGPLIEELTTLVERFDNAINVAELRLKRKLPRPDLRYIRADRANRRAAAAATANAANATAATADDDAPATDDPKKTPGL